MCTACDAIATRTPRKRGKPGERSTTRPAPNVHYASLPLLRLRGGRCDPITGHVRSDDKATPPTPSEIPCIVGTYLFSFQAALPCDEFFRFGCPKARAGLGWRCGAHRRGSGGQRLFCVGSRRRRPEPGASGRRGYLRDAGGRMRVLGAWQDRALWFGGEPGGDSRGMLGRHDHVFGGDLGGVYR